MSELTAYRGDIYIPVYGSIADAQVYLKSEVDKVIAELEADCAYWKTMSRKCADDNEVMAKQRADAFKRERHHKYKRCLVMAWWCSAELGMLVSTWESKIKYYKRWQKRWLELAKQFKDGV